MTLRTAALTGLLAFVVATPQLQAKGKRHHHRKAVYEVTVTNVTRDQSFTPLLVVAHHPWVSLFEVGQPASAELETLAETGDTMPFQELLATVPGVHGVNTGEGLLAPGQTAKIYVKGHRGDRVSFAGMLIPTNDGFVAIDSAGPFGHGAQTFHPPAYDAGTEVNDELCADIPGPYFDECGGAGGMGAPEVGQEGFVRIHEGLHGIGDFDASRRDWKNPVAQVLIRRVR